MTQPRPKRDSPALVDRLFRTAAGDLVARLCAGFGLARLAAAEDAVQESMLAALRVWPTRGTPDNPVAWLYTVARNRMIDEDRKSARHTLVETDELLSDQPDGGAPLDRLDLLISVCSAGLPAPQSVVLSLKVVFGFSVLEIAQLLGLRSKTVELRLYRARLKLRDRTNSLLKPTPASVATRNAVRNVVYVAFTEGFSRPLKASPISVDLVNECISLTETLLQSEEWDDPEMHALLGILYLQGSRIDARHASGEFLTLLQQDRSLWKREWIARGLVEMDRAMTTAPPSRYHIELTIAACYASVVDGGDPPWSRILELYDALFLKWPSPFASLNRAIVVGQVYGADDALAELERIKDSPQLENHHYWWTAQAHFLSESGDRKGATAALRVALGKARTKAERNLIATRLAQG